MSEEKKEEIWKDIPGYEGCYQVNQNGEIKSVDRIYITESGRREHVKERILKPYTNRHGYSVVSLYDKNHKMTVRRVHQIIAEIFVPNDDPDNNNVINHINGIKTDNRAINLEYCTTADNITHAVTMGLLRQGIGENHHRAALTNEQAVQIRYEYAEGNISHSKLAKKYGVSARVIERITEGKSYWEAGGPRVHKDSYVKGEDNPGAKMTNAQVYRARELHNSGKSTPEIIRELNLPVCRSVLQNAISGKTYANVPMPPSKN